MTWEVEVVATKVENTRSIIGCKATAKILDEVAFNAQEA